MEHKKVKEELIQKEEEEKAQNKCQQIAQTWLGQRKQANKT